ncbi:uncharacterized protein KY384_005374 [Bacidia gigantensis]|uniref:uncharacterized protein n=1 Tax=Bacidia gigantensis TaxID=2732470 RepID=UPI001D03EDE1|nr:uncharacterized protein KY384_005374 [Bacidia gigantensis]KAG8529893.1 hypothetical protein KY384_005374 [Bacidia gigantensis]
MVLRSERTATSLASFIPATAEVHTIGGFLQLLQARGVGRCQLESRNIYCGTVLNDNGSQFTIFDDSGIKKYSQVTAVVKRAKVRLSTEALIRTERDRAALTHHSLRRHPNIVQLLYYDLIDNVDNSFLPALVIERAEHGSLTNLLDECPSEIISESNRLSLSADVTAGLLALHQAGIAHGDLKADNILIFGNLDWTGLFVAKLTDFGSIIPTSNATNLRYYGTRLTNAPEVAHQTVTHKLDSEGLIACDNYSLGLLFLQIFTNRLDSRLTTQDSTVLTEALKSIVEIDMTSKTRSMVSDAVQKLLPYDPEARCSDLAFILTVLRPPSIVDASITKNFVDHMARNSDGQNISTGRNESEIAAALQSTFGDSEYLEYEVSDEIWTPKDVQKSVLAQVEARSESYQSGTSGRALFQLAIFHAIGFGAPQCVDLALQCIRQAADRGYLPAQCLFENWHVAHRKPILTDKERQLDNLYDAAIWGSFYAAVSLQRTDSNEYKLARDQFHARGGYNQYFYCHEAPPYIGSAEFRTCMSQTGWSPGVEPLSVLLQSAVIYGDALLLHLLLDRHDMDANQTTRHGESLLTLCCKGGHLAVLKTLVEAGATTYVNEDDVERESPLHWLIAFEDDKISFAMELLQQTGACIGPAPTLAWNHPTIDFPGKFPRATPLHFAIYHNSMASVDAILKGALDDFDVNMRCLADVSSVLSHESWSICGLYGVDSRAVKQRCIHTVSSRALALLDIPEEEGEFTPLMIATQNQDADVVDILILNGCNVNLETSYGNDNRTPLNLLTENRLSYRDNDIFENLIEAGADLHHRSLKGGKLLTHYAARDNNVRILQKALDHGLNLDDEGSLGETPLHLTALYGSVEACRLLLDRGASTIADNFTMGYGKYDWKKITPIGVATIVKNMSLTSLFLQHGGTKLARPRTRDTILHVAVTEYEPDALETLLQLPDFQNAGLLDAKAEKGKTPLHICAANPHCFMQGQLLISAGANVNALLDEGFSALDIACRTVCTLEGMLSKEKGEGFLYTKLALPGSTRIEMHFKKEETGEVEYSNIVDECPRDNIIAAKEGMSEFIVALENSGAKKNRPEGYADELSNISEYEVFSRVVVL